MWLSSALIAFAFFLRRSLFAGHLIFALPIASLAACSLGAAVSYSIQHVNWPYHAYPIRAFLTLAALFLVVDLLRHVSDRFGLARQISPSLALLALLVVGCGTGILITKWRPPIVTNRSELGEALTQYKTPQAGTPQTVYVFSTALTPFAEVLNNGFNWGSRFPCLWNLPALIQNESGPSVPPSLFKRLPPDTLVQRSSTQRLQVAEDLYLYRPSIVLVEQCTKLHPCQALNGKDFDMIPWFLQSPDFVTAWSHYQLQLHAPSGFYLYKRGPLKPIQ